MWDIGRLLSERVLHTKPCFVGEVHRNRRSLEEPILQEPGTLPQMMGEAVIFNSLGCSQPTSSRNSVYCCPQTAALLLSEVRSHGREVLAQAFNSPSELSV